MQTTTEIAAVEYGDNQFPRAACIAAAIERLGAVTLADGDYAYYAEESREWWTVTDDDVAELGAMLLAGESDAYSIWCAEGYGDLVNDTDHDAVEEIKKAGGNINFRCQCGAWSGERCLGEETDRSELVRVRFVPDWQKGSAKASGTYTRGAYATEIAVSEECAEQMRYLRDEDGDLTTEEDPFVEVLD